MEQRASDEAVQRDIRSFIEPGPPLIHHPFMRPRPEKGVKLFEKFEQDSDIEEPDLVQVYLRMKPCKVPNNLYELRSDKCLVTSLDTTTSGHGRRTQHNVSKMYTFSHIFKPECSQKEIFEKVVKDNLKRLVDGYSFTLLTYGASGSGKTYTLMGTVNSPGLVPRSLEYVFKLIDAAQTPVFKPSETGTDHLSHSQQDYELQWVKRHLQISAPYREKYRRMSVQLHNDLTASSIDLTNKTKHYVWVSFVEIYNEAIYDLLAPPDKRAKLRLREDSSGNVYVKGVTQAFVRSGSEAYDVMVAGKHNLVVAATGIHAHSSRSHCIFTITMLTETEGSIRTSHVRLCDLAGCERQRAARNTGARMLESRAINSSLHVLERCLHMLRRNQHSKEAALVPYRECRLTRLLGSGLSGARGEAVTMVVTINPAEQHAHESRHVLSLAVVARDIQINNTMDPAVVTVSSLECTQDSTMHDYSDEIMRLRTENERLHFELLQAQACISQLRRSMEEKQQQSANTMTELVEETKDMMQHYYEEQLASLRTQMKEMEEEYENKLSVMANEGQLIKDKHSEFKNMEIQHLRECVEDRDENEYESNKSSNLDPACSMDSDNESDSENDDLDESLEPVNQLRKSILHKEIPEKNETAIDLIYELSEEESESENDSNNDESVQDEVKAKESMIPNDSLAHNSITISKDSLYATGDDDSEIENESRQIENTIDSMENVIQPILQSNGADMTTEVETEKMTENNNAEQDKSECEEMFNVSTKLDKTEEVIEKDLVPSTLRGTYFVSNDDPQDCNDEQKLKALNTVRGTYFVEPREMSFYKEIDIENGNDRTRNTEMNKESLVKDKESPKKNEEPQTKDKLATEFVKTNKFADTFVNKIIKSFKSRQSSGGSLSQFEQLELAVNNTDNSTDAVKNFEITIPTQTLKGKRYFDDSAKEISITTKEINIPTDELNIGGQRPNSPEKNPTISNFCQMSSAAKTQEKRLLVNSFETSPTSSENLPQSEGLATDTTMQSLILTPKIVKEAQLYYTKNDVITHNDILISRSPSIIRDETPPEYEPSIALKKILGESFTKPEILSSTRKNRQAKKHESVDIFESPLSGITKASSKEMNNIEITAKNNAEEPKDLNIEIASIANLNERANVIAHEFIESLVTSQKIKTYIEREQLASAKTSTVLEIVSDNTKNETGNEVTKEIKQEELKLDTTSFPEASIDGIGSEIRLPDAQTSKENDTVDEFENIVKDLSNVRVTEFELLVSEDINAVPANIKQTQQPITDSNVKEIENTATAERRKKFEETKYNLRNKKSNLNVSDEKKDKETEEVAVSSKAKIITKRCLRLRRRQNLDEDNSEQDKEKLKDIVNLKREFCDVTMGLPAAKKDIKDIPSPEKLPGEEENVPPMMGVQSCPSKSVIRSRRKLFTPRAEPLEESPSQAGDSNERVYVPRPSYHRARARRKL